MADINFILFNAINALVLQYFWLDVLGIFLAKSAGVLFIVLLLGWLVLRKKRRYKLGFSLLLSALISRGLITELMRFLYYVERPFVSHQANQLLPHELTGSFPSGHAAFYFALAGFVYFKDKRAGALFLLLAVLISLARVYAGVHWPADILAGAVIGLACAWLVKKAVKFV